MKNKSKSVKSLADLNKLVNPNIKSNIAPQSVTKPTNVVLGENDTVSIVLWKSLRDLRPRSMSEIQRRIESIVVQQEWYDGSLIDRVNITVVVFNLINAGEMVSTKNAGITLYAFTESASMPTHPEGVTMVEVKTNENVDVAIWQYFSDLRPHSISDAAIVLSTKGFDNRIVRDRIVTLARRNDWFTRNGSGNKLKYVMKKSRTMPVTTMAEIVDKSKRTPFHEPKAVIKSDKGPDTPAVTTLPELDKKHHGVDPQPSVDVITPQKQEPDKRVDDPGTSIAELYKINMPDAIAAQGTMQKMAKNSSFGTFNHNAAVIQKEKMFTDTTVDIKTAIKQIMSDKAFYTLADLNTVLAAYLAVNKISDNRYVYTHMQAMRLDNLFNVEKRGNANFYQLKQVEEVKAEKALDETENDIKETVVETAPTEEPKSFKVLINIKDKYYTTAQTKKIIVALTKFVAQEEVVDDIISLTYQLRLSGNGITVAEAKELLKEFHEFGFNEE